MEGVIPSYKVDELFSVKGKVTLITGMGGYGRVMAEAFAHNGARVILSDHKQSNIDRVGGELTAQGLEWDSSVIAVEDKADVEQKVAEIAEKYGRIDILIHTVGIAPLGPTMDFDDAEMRRTLDVNFYGCVYMNAAVGRVMEKNHWGRIININSIDAYSVNCIDDLPYSASKAAMTASTRHFAVDLAKSGVTVNGIAPVWIYTPMMARRPGDYITQAAGTIPMGRISYSEDYVGMTLFLASDASAYVTGQTFLVDGGWGAYKAFKYSAE